MYDIDFDNKKYIHEMFKFRRHRPEYSIFPLRSPFHLEPSMASLGTTWQLKDTRSICNKGKIISINATYQKNFLR